jgi:hypothetical protein
MVRSAMASDSAVANRAVALIPIVSPGCKKLGTVCFISRKIPNKSALSSQEALNVSKKHEFEQKNHGYCGIAVC